MMGGSGTLSTWDDDLPTWPKPAYFNLIYCAMLGNYMEDIWELFYQEYFMANKQRDFTENLLHHICCIALIVYSHLNNGNCIGFLILWVHNWADVFTWVSKGSVDLEPEIIA